MFSDSEKRMICVALEGFMEKARRAEARATFPEMSRVYDKLMEEYRLLLQKVEAMQ